MRPPTVIDIPHTLGREEARRRMKARIGDLPAHIPGGVAEMRSSWPGEYLMALEIAAMGQRLSATLDVQERSIRVSLILPPMLSFMSDTIASAIREQGSQLLIGD